MTTKPTPRTHHVDTRAMARFVAFPAVATVTIAILLPGRGFGVPGTLLALVLPLGALGLIFVFLRAGGFRAGAGVVSPQLNPRRYWVTIGALGLVYLMGTSALAALLLRSA